MATTHVRKCAIQNGGDCDCWDYESVRLNLCYACTVEPGAYLGSVEGRSVPFCAECFEYECGLVGATAEPFAIAKTVRP